MAVTATAAPPHVTIWQTATAIVASRALQVAAELGVADQIGERPVPVQTLAEACRADAGALERVLRLLASLGIFVRHEGGYAHSDASRVLRTDAPGSMRAFARLMNLRFVNQAFTRLDHSVQTGEPAARIVDPRGIWGHLRDHPDEAQIFGEAMLAKAAADIPAVLEAYDFRRFGTIADIGGGLGHLLRAILERAAESNGILFDLPEVIGSLPRATDRLTPVAGDFFRDALPSADAYILMEVLHDWSDQDCVRILSAIRRAATPGATVTVIEGIVVDAGDDPRVNTMDVLMLAIPGGGERSVAELETLFVAGGFRLNAVVQTAGAMKVVEGVAV